MDEQLQGLRLRFSGRRFQGKRLPVGVLPDIEAFRDLIVAFAKAEWLSSHEGRRRVPRGFDGQLNLDLIAIEDGSSVPVLAPSPAEAQGFLPGMATGALDLFRLSFDRICELIDKAANEPRYKPVLKRDQISALNRFGAGLRSDEKIDFVGSKGAGGAVVSIDAESRKNLITRIRDTYEKRYEGIGRLQVVSAEGWIEVETEIYGVVKFEVGERATAEFDGSLMNEVSFDILLELDAEDKVRRVKEIYAVDLHDAPNETYNSSLERAVGRLREIALLADGWLDGGGSRVQQSIIDIAENLIRVDPVWFAPAGIFPTPEGGIQIELNREGKDLSINIDAVGQLTGDLMDSDGSVEELLDRGAVIRTIGLLGGSVEDGKSIG
ncbi:MAG: hypothetical protein ACKOED_03305 [Aestuariivirga sp.]|uniref:hypothetical protein n=1 Tax=Aestuariivirga sp. TaxID=2650926 RepID=UPI0038CFC20E